MQDRDMYFRTQKGGEEISNRSKAISMICRHVLIMVNGSMSVGELAQNAPDSWQVRDKLIELESLGLISIEKS